MTYTVKLTLAAQADLLRMAEFLADYGEEVARRGSTALWAGFASLSEMPRRFPVVGKSLRELYIRFGDSGYVVQYRVDADVVVIARIFHMREAR